MNRAVVMVFVLTILAGSSTVASAGFLDTFNKANQAIQQASGTVANTKRTIQSTGIKLPQKAPTAVKQAVAKTPTPQTSGTLSAQDKAGIEKAKRAYVAAFKAEDWDALVDQYAENAVVLPPDDNIVTGHEAIRAYFATDDDTSNEIFKTVDMKGDGQIAYVQGNFSFNISSGGKPPVFASGKYIEVWEKQPDGNWLITHDIWNANPM